METSAGRTDLAVLDRMVTLRITANDTGWRRHLAARHPTMGLTEVFRLWAGLSPDLRHLLSPRTWSTCWTAPAQASRWAGGCRC